MNPTMLVVLAVVGAIAAIVLMLVFFGQRLADQKAAAMRKTYQALLRQHNIIPTQEEEFQHRILGLDTIKRVLVSVQPASEKPYERVPLEGIADCQVRKDGMTLQRQRGTGKPATEEYIHGISLSLLCSSGHAIDVPVYSEIIDGQDEKIVLHKKAMKWQERIRATLGRN